MIDFRYLFSVYKGPEDFLLLGFPFFFHTGVRKAKIVPTIVNGLGLGLVRPSSW
jgi:hypothetical protein